MIASAAAVDENLNRPFVPNLNAVNMLAPASVAIIATTNQLKPSRNCETAT